MPMLDALKRLFAGRSEGPAHHAVSAWAASAGYVFKRARESQGFVVEGGNWRLEVGPPQRDYIDGPELRLRCDTEMPSDLQMLVISRPLMTSLESETFEQFTDSVQTYADDSAPEEMRWLAMFPKLDSAALGPLGARFGAAALVPAAVQAWIGGGLGTQLQACTVSLPADHPIVLMTNRGRVTLRTELQSTDDAALAAWVALFETALRRLPDARIALRQATTR